MGDEVQPQAVPVGGVPVVAQVADAERERAIGWLRHHCGLGNLTLDEFGDRAGHVYAARTDLELWSALDGLAVPKETPEADVPEPRVTPAAGRRSGSRWHIALFGGADRRGRWRIAPSSIAVAMFGAVTLDLRNVTLEDPDATEVSITGLAMFGGVDILVPEGMEVDITGIALFGGKDCRLADVPPNPGLPLLKVRAFVMFGGFDVRSRPPVKASRLAKEVRRESRKAARELRHG